MLLLQKKLVFGAKIGSLSNVSRKFSNLGNLMGYFKGKYL